MKKLFDVVKAESSKMYRIYDEHPYARTALVCCAAGFVVSRITNVPTGICVATILELALNTEKLSLPSINKGAMPD
jgi:hypothetical protein